MFMEKKQQQAICQVFVFISEYHKGQGKMALFLNGVE